MTISPSEAEIARLRQLIEDARKVIESTSRPVGSPEARLANDIWQALGGSAGPDGSK